MRIIAISTTVLQLPFAHGGAPLYFAGRPRTAIEMLLVRVDTYDGYVGWGEAFGPGVWPATQAVIENILAPLCIGSDTRDIGALSDDLQRKLHPLGRSGPVIYALAGLDIALWDIAGQRAGVPLCRLLAHTPAEDLPAYASLFRYADAQLVGSKCAEAIERGYRDVKLHEVSVDSARAARKAIGSQGRLMIDVNCPWSADQAIRMAQQFREFDPLWLEEPVWPPEDHAGLARVRREGGIPIAAGENAASVTEFGQMFASNAIDYAQPSVIKIGGITPMLGVIELARRHGTGIMPHSPYFGPGLIATLHVCAARAPAAMIETYYCDLEASPLGSAITPHRGRLSVPQGRGLGVTPDPAVLREYAVR